MIYSKEVFAKAENEINARHTEALALLEKHRIEIEENAPEIANVNNQLISTSAQLSKAIMSRDNNLNETINKIKEQNLKGQKLIKELLQDFGYPINYLDLQFTCHRCQDTGYVNGIRCECFNELLRKYSIEELNANCSIQLCDFNDFNLDFYTHEQDKRTGISPYEKMAVILNACKEYANNFTKNSVSLLFCGNTGLGKTLLSSAIAKELLMKGYHVAFDSVQNYLRAIENEHFGRVTDKDTLQVLSDADLVILDDLGSEFTSQFYSSALYNIINTRLNKGIPTIISTNLSLDELQKRYNDRIISRLTGCFSWRMFIGKDVRQINSVMKR